MDQPIFKGVLWKREKQGGFHRTAVVGLLLTRDPIENATEDSFTYHQGLAWGLDDALRGLEAVEGDQVLGDACSVMTGLNYMRPATPTQLAQRRKKVRTKKTKARKERS